MPQQVKDSEMIILRLYHAFLNGHMALISFVQVLKRSESLKLDFKLCQWREIISIFLFSTEMITREVQWLFGRCVESSCVHRRAASALVSVR